MKEVITTESSIIGENLKAQRKKAKLTQEQFAHLMNVGQQTVSAWENGTRMMDALQILNAAKVLRCSIYSLYDGLLFSDTSLRLSEELQRISAEDREIIKFVFTSWQGDAHALLQSIGMYCTVPKSYRADIAGMCIHQYEKALAENAATNEFSIDVDYIENSWMHIAKDKKKI